MADTATEPSNRTDQRVFCTCRQCVVVKNGNRSNNSAPDSPSERSSRRVFVRSVGCLAAGAALAGCSGDDINPPQKVTDESEGSGDGGGGSSEGGAGGSGGSGGGATDEPPERQTPRTVDAALGDVIEDDRIALATYGVERTTDIDEFTSADVGNEFVVVDLAAKNKSNEEFVSFSSLFQVTLRDSESYEYDQSITGSGGALASGELAPGEVTRGTIVFETPMDSSGLSLHVDLSESLWRYDGAIIDLESEGTGRTLTQDLQIETYALGDTVEFRDTRFTPEEFRTSMGGEYFGPDQGNEFAIVDITVENTGDEELTISTLLQMDLKDQEGRTYDVSISALTEIDRGFSQGNPIAPNTTRRGEVAFEVPQGSSPLYLVIDFDFFREGDKTFFRLR